MILNPPHIVTLLRNFRSLIRQEVSREILTRGLAGWLLNHQGHQPYSAFLRFYQLYLQSIPLEIAKAAWGLNAAAAAAQQKTTH